MGKRLIIIAVLCLICIGSLTFTVFAQTTEDPGAQSGEKIQSTGQLPDISEDTPVENRVVVVYKEKQDENIDKLDLTADQVDEATTLTDQLDVVKPAEGQSAEALAADLDSNDQVASAFVDGTMETQSLPNDPLLSKCSYLYYNIGNANAWNTVTGTSNVKVAVIDSGCYTSHPDLTGRVSAVNDIFGAYYPQYSGEDLFGHGTAVSGILAASVNNLKGSAGVAGSTNVTIVPYRCGGKNTSDTQINISCVVASLQKIAADSSIKVVNMSFGGTAAGIGTSAMNAMHTAVQQVASSGKVLVAAAGNNDTKGVCLYPASFDEVISVSATDANDQICSFSDTNDQVEVAAPGNNLESAGITGSYVTEGGTSFSSPVVAGEAAMIFAKNSALTADEVRQIISDTAKDLGTTGKDDEYGNGLVQIDNALQIVEQPAAPLLTVSGTPDQGTAIVMGTRQNAVTFSASGTRGTTPYTFHYVVTQNGTQTAESTGSTFTWTPTATGTYTITVTLTDAAGETAEKQYTYTVSTDNLSIASFSADKVSGEEKPVEWPVNVTAQAQNGYAPYTYAYVITKDGQEVERKNASSDSLLTWTPDQEGNYKITLTVQDRLGASVSRTMDYTVNLRRSLIYQTHVEDIGWQGWRNEGEESGTDGQAKRLEAIEISLDSANYGYAGGITYQTHIQDIGWQGWRSDGAMSGTSGQAKRLEAIQIQLTGDIAEHYDIYYRVHAENIGWMGWAKNGESAGTSGYSYRLEAIEIRLVAKGSAAPGSTDNAYVHPLVQYQTHVQDFGWQAWMKDGALSGTAGQAKRLEGIKIQLVMPGYSGDVQYKTHIQDYGWEKGWKQNGDMSGTSGEAKRLEAIQIQLTGTMAQKYDIYYRVHAENIGWMDWASNGKKAGTAGYAYRLEAIQIVLVPKGNAAPGSTARPFVEK